MLVRFNHFLLNVSVPKFILIVLSMVIIKTGPIPIGKEWVEWLFSASNGFPVATSYLSYSLLPVFLAKVVGINSYLMWIFLHLVILFFWIYLVVKKLDTKFQNHGRILAMLFLLSPAVTISITMIGHYDVLSLIGGSMVWLSSSYKYVFMGAVIASGANPNMALAVGICLLLLSWGTRFKFYFYSGVVWVFTSISFLIFTNIFYKEPISGTRESIVISQFGMVFRGVAGEIMFVVLSVLGVLIFPLGWILGKKHFSFGTVTNSRLLSIYLGSCVIPVVMAILILDHTRIGVVVSTVPIMLLLISEGPRLTEFISTKVKAEVPLLSFILLLWFAIPPVIVDSGGVFRLPYAKLLSYFFGW